MVQNETSSKDLRWSAQVLVVQMAQAWDTQKTCHAPTTMVRTIDDGRYVWKNYWAVGKKSNNRCVKHGGCNINGAVFVPHSSGPTHKSANN